MPNYLNDTAFNGNKLLQHCQVHIWDNWIGLILRDFEPEHLKRKKEKVHEYFNFFIGFDASHFSFRIVICHFDNLKYHDSYTQPISKDPLQLIVSNVELVVSNNKHSELLHISVAYVMPKEYIVINLIIPEPKYATDAVVCAAFI